VHFTILIIANNLPSATSHFYTLKIKQIVINSLIKYIIVDLYRSFK